MPFLRDILRSQEQLDQTAAELRGLSAGTVRIATFTSVAVHWLPGMMQEFQTLYPHVEFKLFNGDYHDVDRWLTDGSVDIGFITLPTALRSAQHTRAVTGAMVSLDTFSCMAFFTS